MRAATALACAVSPAAPTSAMFPSLGMSKPVLPPMRLTVPPSSSTPTNSGSPHAPCAKAWEFAIISRVWSAESRFFWKYTRPPTG